MADKEWTKEELEAEIRKMLQIPWPKSEVAPQATCAYDKDNQAHLAQQHFTEPQPILCKYCGSNDLYKYGSTSAGEQVYYCKACKRKFTAKDTPFYGRTPVEQIGAALNMYYDGMSLSAISRHFEETFSNPINPSTVYRWILRYTMKALEMLEPLTPQVSESWVVDETVIKVAGSKLWFWDMIDERTRFLLASHMSKTRGMLDVVAVMRRAWDRAKKAPKTIISDQLNVYPDGIERVFGAYSNHIQAKGLTEDINTNLIERFHGTLKSRVKVLRGFKHQDTAELILDGFLIHYNFFRPHMSLQDRTPAEVAKIKAPVKNWTELVKGYEQSGLMNLAQPVCCLQSGINVIRDYPNIFDILHKVSNSARTQHGVSP